VSSLDVVIDGHAQEAVEWVETEVGRLRSLSYDGLVDQIGTSEHRPMQTRDGRQLVLETQIFWDDHREQSDVRVLVDVWDPAKRVSVRSLAKDDFIRAPDGSFVGE
jgi:hypothetical protein